MKNFILILPVFAIATFAQSSTSSPSGSAAPSQQSSGTSSGTMAQSSPSWLSDVKPLPGNVQSYPAGGAQIPTGPLSAGNITLQGYPTGWASPPTDSPEVQAVYNTINWSLVPNSTVRTANQDGTVKMDGYDQSDPDCWWSATGCTTPKHQGVEPDIVNCPTPGDWGLTYDDGPLTSDAGQWAEPNLYNFLANHSQKAALFYIGSNVIQAPAAAQRALADGHTICSHTWSHPSMTTQSNEMVVAELYWTLRAIKEVIGVTPKCWRPPYGDVDDRVRAIANQMGMSTVLWDLDTNDWNMPGDGGGNLSPDTVDGYFEGWVEARKNGTDTKSGHIVLEHELNNATVSMAEKWLPQIQQVFRVVPFNQCMNISQPYWETNFNYPTLANPTPSNASSRASPTTSNSGNSIGSAAGASSSNKSGATSTSSSVLVTTMVVMMGVAYLL